MKLTKIILLVVAFAVCGVPRAAWATQAGGRKTRAAKSDKAKAWKEISSREGGFSVLMPGTPERLVQRLPTPDGKVMEVVIHSLRTSNQYGVIYADYPVDVSAPGAARLVLDEVVKDAFAEVKSVTLDEREISLGAHPGRALTQRLAEGQIMHVRMYLVGPRLYQVAVTLPGADGADAATLKSREETAAKFLDSFKLLNEREAKPTPEY